MARCLRRRSGPTKSKSRHPQWTGQGSNLHLQMREQTRDTPSTLTAVLHYTTGPKRNQCSSSLRLRQFTSAPPKPRGLVIKDVTFGTRNGIEVISSISCERPIMRSWTSLNSSPVSCSRSQLGRLPSLPCSVQSASDLHTGHRYRFLVNPSAKILPLRFASKLGSVRYYSAP